MTAWFGLFIDLAALLVFLWVIVVINRYERHQSRVEGELRGAQERLTLALEASTSAVWDWNLQRDEIYLSAGWMQMLGAGPAETTVASASLLELVHPQDLPRVQKAVQDALTGHKSEYREEHRVRRSDGEWIWILSSGKVVLRDSGGRALRLIGTNQDVTIHKRLELALAEHDERLRLALATASMASWDWDVVLDEFSWQDDPEHVAGPRPAGGYSSLQDLVHPEDLVHFIRTLEDVARSGKAYRGEFRVTRTDGRVIWAHARGRPERNAKGKVVRVMGIVQDISEIRAAEQALRDSERQMRLLTNAVPAVITYQDSEQRIQYCNMAMARMVGMRPESVVGHSLREIFGEDAYSRIRPFVLRALAGEQVQYERTHVSPRGPVDLSVTYVPRHNQQGAVEGFYGLATDISELKRLDRMKSEFVSTVSHELRTPLTSIRGSLGVLAGGVAGTLPEKARQFIEIAKNNCERLIRLINDILDVEKIESGKMTFELRVVDLMELVGQVVAANEGFAAQHNVRLQISAAPPGARVHADGDRLAQVLTNLVSNACKFSPAGSAVDISVSVEGERVRVGVVDHGPGIAEAFQKRIFQKFSQADSSDIRQKGGTGLGLSISKAIVEGLGGSMGFETEAGKGTTFHFELPLWREPGAAAIGTASRPRVLVCDNDPDIGKLICVMVDRSGCDSDLAQSAAEAKALMRERSYAAITLDIGLPDQDGLALLRELHSDAQFTPVPVIVVSATAEEGKLKLDGERLGIVDWLSKPIDEQRLLADLRSTVRAGEQRTRVLHVEDDADVCSVVRTLAQDFAECEAAGSLAEAKARLQRGNYDLVLLDLGLPDGSGWDLLPLIESMTPSPRVVIFSARDADPVSRERASTFLVKSQTSEQQLIDAIKEAVKRPG